ncbi:MAG: carbohydrate ABC transporter permease [Spirochaetia bacterium]
MIKKKFSKTAVWIILLIGFTVFIFPFVFMVSNSFEKFSFVLPVPPRVIPEKFVLDNYIEVIRGESIAKYFMNSVIITAGTLFISLFISSLSAYGFARMNFPGKEMLFSIYLITLMIPGVLNIIPQYLIINRFGGTGTRWGLMLLYIGTAVCGNTFFLRGFFSTVPKELQESVMMDGGSHFTFLFRFMIPISLPSLATLSILIFQGTWDDFFTARVILGPNRSAHTLPIMVQRLHGAHATEWGLVFSAAILMLMPVLLIYIIFQKRFVVGGKISGAVKA